MWTEERSQVIRKSERKSLHAICTRLAGLSFGVREPCCTVTLRDVVATEGRTLISCQDWRSRSAPRSPLLPKSARILQFPFIRQKSLPYLPEFAHARLSMCHASIFSNQAVACLSQLKKYKGCRTILGGFLPCSDSACRQVRGARVTLQKELLFSDCIGPPSTVDRPEMNIDVAYFESRTRAAK